VAFEHVECEVGPELLHPPAEEVAGDPRGDPDEAEEGNDTPPAQE
jgi:hypothetical protein